MYSLCLMARVPYQTESMDQSTVRSNGLARYVLTVLSPLDLEIGASFEDENFLSYLSRSSTIS